MEHRELSLESVLLLQLALPLSTRLAFTMARSADQTEREKMDESQSVLHGAGIGVI